MELQIIEKNGYKIALVQSEDIVIATAQDALDLMATLRYEHDCERVILPRACLTGVFFDLKTGIAGEILQKYTNYHIKIAIIGDFSEIKSKALRDFIYESNQGSGTFFLPDQEAATEALARG